MPPAGTAIFLDAKGLSVGSETFAWPSLAIDQVELTRTSASSGETSTVIHIVDRLSLSAGTKTVVLDRTMLQNGLLLVDNAWRKLRRHGARSWELRAATDLAMRINGQHRSDEARTLLQPVLDQFAEGNETADVKAAGRLLASLGQESPAALTPPRSAPRSE